MLLVHKLKLVPIAGYLRSAAYYDAVVLIAMIATLDAIQINLNVPISPIGNEKPCVSHSVLLTLEWHILLVRCWSVLRWLGSVLCLCPFLGSLLRVGVLLVLFPCVDESDAVRIDGDLGVALALAVCPLRCGDSSLYENEPSLGEVFSQTDMVLTAAAYPYPCSDVLTFGIIIDGNIHCHECSVCSCDDLAILADASDSVSVNHNLEVV